MITRRHLREIHGNDLPLHVLEQDYIQSIFLEELYKKDDSLAFKGGTYIKHAYGLDRFSEDLDFTLRRPYDIEPVLAHAASRLGSYGIVSSIIGIIEDDISFNARLVYRGPLYDGTERSRGNIRIEISKRDDIIKTPVWTKLFFKYPETGVVNVLGLREEEVLSEKIRALSMRSKGRDLYDVWFLLKKEVVPELELFGRKMKVMDRDPVVRIDLSDRDWNEDLRILLSKPPEYRAVLDFVVERLTGSGFELTL